MRHSGRLRFGAPGPWRQTALALAVVAALAGPGTVESARQRIAMTSIPTASTPMTVSYQGSFDLTNTMVPAGTQHSYVYHVEWAFSWSGTWGDLFADGSVHSIQTSFRSARITGYLHATWRIAVAGPDVKCTLRIVPETGDYPDFHAIYDPAAGAVRIAGLEAPTSRYGKYTGNPDPMCGGGPQIDVFGAPAAWKPLGESGAALSLSGNGVHHYDKTWRWSYSFGHGLSRTYISSFHSTVQVGV